jgi:opacity protein-like surface antigen
VRARYPVLNDRLTPYVIAGAGIGFGEFNDWEVPVNLFPIGGGPDVTVPAVAVGAGLEYYLADNVAVGVDARHFFLFDTEVEIAGQKRDLSLDTVALTAGIRLFFP